MVLEYWTIQGRLGSLLSNFIRRPLLPSNQGMGGPPDNLFSGVGHSMIGVQQLGLLESRVGPTVNRLDSD